LRNLCFCFISKQTLKTTFWASAIGAQTGH
jgi:hypothetical protein